MVRKLNIKTSLAIIDQSLFSVSNFLVALLFARANTIELFGIFSILMTVVIAIILVQYSLITQPHNIIAGKFNNKKGRYFHYQTKLLWNFQVFFIFILCATLLIVYTIVSLLSLINIEIYSVIIFVLFVVFRLIFEFMRRVFYSSNDLKRVFVIGLVFNSFLIGGGGIEYLTDSITINNLMLVFLFSSVFASIVGYKIGQNKNVFGVELKYIYRGAYKSWDTGKWILGSNFVMFFSNRAYIFIVLALTSSTTVGVYAAMLNIINIFNPLMLTISNYYMPLASREATKGSVPFNKLIFKIHSLILPILLLVMLLVSAFSYELLYYLYGEKYSEHYLLLRYFSVVILIVYLSNIYQLCLKSYGNTISVFYSSLISLFFILTFGLYFVKTYFLDGVIFVQIVALLVSVGALKWFWLRTR